MVSSVTDYRLKKAKSFLELRNGMMSGTFMRMLLS